MQLVLKAELDNYDKLSKEYAEESLKIDNKLKELSKFLMDARELSANQGHFYSYRQVLVSRKFDIMTKYSNISSLSRKENRLIMDSYKSGIKQSDLVSNINMRPNNDKEREIIYGDDMRDVDRYLSLVNNHITFLVDSIKTVDQMIYGFEYTMKLEEYRQHRK